MTRPSRRCIRSKSARTTLSSLSTFLIVALLLGLTARAAEGPGPVLTVPASPVTLDVAVPLEAAAKVDATARWHLVEADHPDVSVPAQLLPALTPDGLPHETAKRVAALIPPREGAQGPRRFALKPTQGEQAGQGRQRPLVNHSFKHVASRLPYRFQQPAGPE